MKRSLTVSLLFVSLMVATAAPQPVLSISANHGTAIELPRGWPLFVTGTLMHSDRLNKTNPPAPLMIDPPNGASWIDAIQLRVTAADGSERVWNFQPTGTAEQRTLSMGPRQFSTFGWTLSPAETVTIPAGEYRLMARMVVQSASGWSGEASSSSVKVSVIEEAVALDEAKGSEKATLRARYELGAGNVSGAGSVIDQFLTAYPTNSRALVMRSRVLEAQRKPVHAWVAAKEALSTEFSKNSNPQEPPFSLIERERELWKRLGIPRLAAAWVGGTLQLTLTGEQGATYSLQTSATLANWGLAQSVTPTNQNGMIVFPAPTTNGEPHRFYRAVSP